MQITVVDVGALNTMQGKNGRSYQSLEIAYKNEQGQIQSKKLMSFGNAEVFKAAQGWTKGEVVGLTTEKDANGYWQWTALGDNPSSSATLSAPARPAAGGTRVTGSNYETSEERSARQVMIVRQSSLSNAVATLALDKNNTSSASARDVIELAKEYEGYVLSKSTPSIDEVPSDIPF